MEKLWKGMIKIYHFNETRNDLKYTRMIVLDDIITSIFCQRIFEFNSVINKWRVEYQNGEIAFL